MDMRVIDVVIGLALIFAILSLMATAMQELLASLRNSRGKNLEEALLNLFGTSTVLAKSVLAHPLIDSLHKKATRMPSYIPADLFVSALLNSLKAGPRTDAPIHFVSNLPDPYRAEIGKILEALVAGAEHDWNAFEQRIRTWYDQTMERATGAYKRYTQAWLLVIGLVLAVGLNVDTIAVTKKLWTDRDLRESTVKLAVKMDAERAVPTSKGPDAPKKEEPKAAPKKEEPKAALKPDAAKKDGAGMPKPVDPALSVPAPSPDPLKKPGVSAPGNAASGKTGNSDAQKAQKDLEDSLKNLKDLIDRGLPIGWKDSPLPLLTFDFWRNNPFAWLGWLLTALAISLGAPFWFDLMSKFIKIRGAGQRPGGEQPSGEAQRPSSPVPAGGGAAPRGTPSQPFQYALNEPEAALTRKEVERIQQVLKVPNGQITGQLDASTRTFITQWQKGRSLPATGELTSHQIQMLLAA